MIDGGDAGGGACLGIEIGGTKLQICAGNHEGARSSNGFIGKSRRPMARRAFAPSLSGPFPIWPDAFVPPPLGLALAGRSIGRAGRFVARTRSKDGRIFPLASWLSEMTRTPVVVDNDANVAALGEAAHGAGVGFNPVFYVTLGSGVGGGLVVDGRIFHGARPGEAEIGHLRLDRSGALLESRCSGWAVDARIRAAGGGASGTARWRVVLGTATRGEARFLAAALAQKDPLAKAILDETAEDLAFGLSHVAHLFHPEIIVLGGGLALIGEPLRAAVEYFLPRYIMEAFAPGPKIALARLAQDAVPVGALALALARQAG